MSALTRPPAWALSLVERVAVDHGIAPPEVHWYQKKYERGSHGHSSAKVNGRRYIFIAAGTNRTSQRYVVLHEMVHRIVRDDDSTHGPKFWRKFIELCRQYGLPISALLEREGDVPLFKRVYQEMGGRW